MMNLFFKYPTILLKTTLVALLLFFVSEVSLAIDPPVLLCASVDPNDGSIYFEWEPSTNPDVEGYQIFRSNDDFVVDLPGAAVNNYVLNGLDATTAQYCFYMYSYTNGGAEFSDQSEVTCTIFIEVTPSTTPPGYAQIVVNGPHDTWENPPNGSYILYLSVDNGPFEPVNYLPISDNVLHYEVIHCEAEYEFYVFLTGSNCVSNYAGQVFFDERDPPIPFITTLSIDSTNLNVNIEWSMPSINDEPSMANLGGYIVYQYDPLAGVGVIIEIIEDPSVLEYSFETSITSYNQFSFQVASFDVCLDDPTDPTSFSNLGSADPSYTMVLTPPTYDCESIVLSWLPYVSWTEGWDDAFGVGSYEIFVKENGQPELSLGFADLLNFDGTYYTDTLYNMDLTSNYSFFIKAHSTMFNYTAISNIQTINLTAFTGPERTYLGAASVFQNDAVEITIKTDTTITDYNYVIQKREETDDVYQDLVTIANSNHTLLTYLDDEDIAANKFTYEYRVAVINYCGDTVAKTNSARTMLASATKNDIGLYNVINWTAYQTFELPIEQYSVYRSNALGVLGEEIITLPNNNKTYVDYFDDMAIETNGFFCYTILATETAGNIHNYQGESFSNQICTQFEPLIYIPNAFVVGGNNPEFRPVIELIDEANYSMEIYSRSGNLIFKSTSVDLGWNGTNGGTQMPDGAYVYLISVKDGQGKLHEKSGMVFKLSRE